MTGTGFGGRATAIEYAGERRRPGRCRGKIDGKIPRVLGPALPLNCLAVDRRSGEKGIEADRGRGEVASVDVR